MLYYPSYAFSDIVWEYDLLERQHDATLARNVMAKRKRNYCSTKTIGYAVKQGHFHNHATNNRYESLHRKTVLSSNKMSNTMPEGIYTTFFLQPNTLYYVTPHFL